MKKFQGFERGVGIGGWLNNYKRLRYIPVEYTTILTQGDWIHFDTFITEDDVRRIASWGMDHIRLGFDFVLLEDENEPFVYREEGFRYLDNCLEWCRRNGLNLVLDMHRAPGGCCEFKTDYSLFDEERKSERFVKLWEAIAGRYANGRDVAFELLNELCAPEEYYDRWNQLVARTIQAIHAVSPDSSIVLGGGGHNKAEALQYLDLYNDDRIVYNFHFYAPHIFTHQRSPNSYWTAIFNRYLTYPGEITPYIAFYEMADRGDINKTYIEYFNRFEGVDKTFLADCLQPALEFQRAHDKVLYCSEFGVIRHAPMQSRINWFRDVIDLFRENDISYSAWNYLTPPYDPNRFSLVDDWDHTPLSDELIRVISGKELQEK